MENSQHKLKLIKLVNCTLMLVKFAKFSFEAKANFDIATTECRLLVCDWLGTKNKWSVNLNINNLL